MDSTVIQEIADQLGMAVDTASSFIAENLPAYASLKAMQSIMPVAIIAAILLMFLLIALVASLYMRSILKRDRSDGVNRGLYNGGGSMVEAEDYISFWVTITSLTLAFVTFILLTLAIFGNLSDFIGWTNYPQAMLIDSALKAIG